MLGLQHGRPTYRNADSGKEMPQSGKEMPCHAPSLGAICFWTIPPSGAPIGGLRLFFIQNCRKMIFGIFIAFNALDFLISIVRLGRLIHRIEVDLDGGKL